MALNDPILLPGSHRRVLTSGQGKLSFILGHGGEDDQVVELPADFKEVYAQNRQCGDWYFYIEKSGNKMFSATAALKDEAFLLCFAKAVA